MIFKVKATHAIAFKKSNKRSHSSWIFWYVWMPVSRAFVSLSGIFKPSAVTSSCSAHDGLCGGADQPVDYMMSNLQPLRAACRLRDPGLTGTQAPELGSKGAGILHLGKVLRLTPTALQRPAGQAPGLC